MMAIITDKNEYLHWLDISQTTKPTIIETQK